jgi:energy-coupling factor transport system ATP-binding protein
MGRNGAGKSTLLNNVAGVAKPNRGVVTVAGIDPTAVAPSQLIRSVGLVPQDASVLLFSETVAEECRMSDRDSGVAEGTTSDLLDSLVPGISRGTHPRDLSEGQRLSLALAVILAPSPQVLCLDEPTRGLDQPAKDSLVSNLRRLAGGGHTVMVATHDVELVAEVAQRVVVIGDAEVVDDGPARRVVCHSPVFSPQVARIMAPDEWLTVSEVGAALGVVGDA